MTRPALSLAHPPALLRAEHAAAYLGISASLLRDMAARGEAPAPVMVRSLPLWRRADLDAWAASLPAVGETAAAGEREACDQLFGR